MLLHDTLAQGRELISLWMLGGGVVKNHGRRRVRVVTGRTQAGRTAACRSNARPKTSPRAEHRRVFLLHSETGIFCPVRKSWEFWSAPRQTASGSYEELRYASFWKATIISSNSDWNVAVRQTRNMAMQRSFLIVAYYEPIFTKKPTNGSRARAAQRAMRHSI